MPRLLSGFGELHPDVAIGFEEGPQDTLQRRLLEGELELALLYDMAVLPELERVELFRARPHVVLPADHPLATGTHVALRDMEAEPMVLLDSPPSSIHTLLLCDQAGIRPSVRYRPTNFETTRGLVGRGLGCRFGTGSRSQSHGPLLRGRRSRSRRLLGADSGPGSPFCAPPSPSRAHVAWPRRGSVVALRRVRWRHRSSK